MNLLWVILFFAVLAVPLYAASRVFARSKFKEITPAQLRAMLCKETDFVIFDVREPWEFRQGYIYKSLNLPMRKISGQMEELSKLKEDRIVVVCKSGLRSRMVCAFLEKEGFAHLLHLKGGIKGWLKMDLKLVTGKESGEIIHGA